MTDLDNVSDDRRRPLEMTTAIDLRAEVDALRLEVDELRSEMARLDSDIGESRRLNLRAAELLDLVFEQLGRPRE